MKDSGDKFNILKAGAVLAATTFLLGCIFITARYMCLLQHVSTSDGFFFSGDKLWLKCLRALSGLMGIDVIVFCHKFWPYIFLALMIVIYFFLGIVLFSEEGRSKAYVYTMTCIFMGIFLLIIHGGYNGNHTSEALVYIECWQGYMVSAILLTPLMIMALYRKKWLLLIPVALIYIPVSGFDNFKTLLQGRTYISFGGGSWLFVTAAFGLIMMIFLKKKPARVLLAAALLTTGLLVVRPYGIIAAYSITMLIGEARDKASGEWKRYAAGAAAFMVLTAAVAAAGFFSNGRVSWNVRFTPIENDLRLPQDIIDIAEYLGKNDPDETVYGSDVTDSAFTTYSRYKQRTVKSQALWAETSMDIKGMPLSYGEINQMNPGSYVIIRNVSSGDRQTAEDNGLVYVDSFGEYMLYRR